MSGTLTDATEPVQRRRIFGIVELRPNCATASSPTHSNVNPSMHKGSNKILVQKGADLGSGEMQTQKKRASVAAIRQKCFGNLEHRFLLYGRDNVSELVVRQRRMFQQLLKLGVHLHNH